MLMEVLICLVVKCFLLPRDAVIVLIVFCIAVVVLLVA